MISGESLEKLTDEQLFNLHDALTSARYQGRPSRDQLIRDTNDDLWPRLRKIVKEKIENLIYVPAIREVRLAADGKSEAKGFDPSGQDIIHHLRKMQHPVFGKEQERKVFEEIEKFVTDLLSQSVEQVHLEIPADEDDIYVTMYGNRLPLHSFGTGVHELVILQYVGNSP